MRFGEKNKYKLIDRDRVKICYKTWLTNHILPLIFLISAIANQKALADTPNQLQGINHLVEIVRKNKGNLSLEDLSFLKTKIADIYYKLGKDREAIIYLGSAIEINRENAQNKFLSRNLINIARAYLNLGQTFVAQKNIEEAIVIARQENFENILYSAYLILGNIHKLKGEYIEAKKDFEQSLKYAAKIEQKISINTNLSKLLYIQFSQNQIDDYRDQALLAAHKAVELSENIESLVAVEAYLQLLKLGYKSSELNYYGRHKRLESPQATRPYLNKVEAILSTLPDSIQKTYALINLSKYKQNSVAVLNQAISIAESLNNKRATSFALGHLGAYYEQKQQHQKALAWTNKAIQAALQSQAHESLYRWYWQQGRINIVLDRQKEAIAYYYQAIASLQAIREELAKSQHIDFELEIEPVYRELLQLLFSNPTSKNIKRALEIKSLLQISELEDYFGDDCLEVKIDQDKSTSNSTAFIYTVILPEATHIVVKQGDLLNNFQLDISQTQIKDLIKQWRYSLENRTDNNYLLLSKKIHDLIINPIEPLLKENQIKTLVFINDGMLRNLPMSALHNGQRFLIEDYVISSSLGLNSQVEDSSILTTEAKTLVFGLSEQGQDYFALPAIEEELQSINKLLKVRQFVNADFTVNKVSKELIKDFSLVHFATHGKFDDTLNKSYLNAYQEQISLNNFSKILRQQRATYPNRPIELLVLSACETAIGSDRATLGLAGLAIRSGVLNTVGSLWAIEDRAGASLVTEFYNGLIEEKLSPAKALRQAQIMMIEKVNYHPSTWANLILIAS